MIKTRIDALIQELAQEIVDNNILTSDSIYKNLLKTYLRYILKQTTLYEPDCVFNFIESDTGSDIALLTRILCHDAKRAVILEQYAERFVKPDIEEAKVLKSIDNKIIKVLRNDAIIIFSENGVKERITKILERWAAHEKETN